MTTANDILKNVPKLIDSDFTTCGSLPNKTGVYPVLFYTSTCRFCRDFVPEFIKLSSHCSRRGGSAYAVNMEYGNNKTLADRSTKFPFDLAGYPTIVLYYNESPCSLYLGPRTVEKIIYEMNMKMTRQQCTLPIKTCM